MKCRHPKIWRFRHGKRIEAADYDEPMLLECERCNNCGAWLSLGPANDADERVAIEVRAAEIAANVSDRRVHTVQIDEDIGWRHNGVRDFDRPWAIGAQESGYLARAITQHPEGGE